MFAACGIALLVAAGCSGGDDKQASPPASAEAGGQPVDTRFTGQGSAEFCNEARTYSERSKNVAAPSTPAQVRSVAQEGQAAINQAVNLAPTEIKPDIQVIAAAFGSMLSELEKVNFDVSKVTPATFAKLQEPQFATSTQRFQAYVANVCKLPS